ATFADDIKFVIAAGSTDFVVGDKFTIAVTNGTATAPVQTGTGNGVMTLDATTPVLAGAKNGSYVVTCVTAAADRGTFRVEDPDGYVLGDVAVGATFADDIKFVIAAGSTDFIVGDMFTITVTTGAGRIPLDGTSGKPKATWETTTTAGQIGILRVSS
ncbi:MAG TPA: hypothetical protein PLE35_08970, partial [Lentisphaeria bacterium]|nr:hypothetical protein [Lentisphaeria bacterium]